MRSERTLGALGLTASLVPALAGLVASSMLAVDYLRPAPVFCAEGGGCDALRHTAFAALFGIPLPLLGMTGFFAVGAASLFPQRRARTVQFAFAAVAGLAGLALLGIQASLRTVCPFCCIADGSGILSAIVAAARLWRVPPVGAPPALSYAGAATLVLGAVGPLMVSPRPTLPPAIRDEMAQTPPGKVTIVDFVDFECPFCRMTHAEFQPLVQQHQGRLRLARRQVPLSMHPHARAAARAACCGDLLGKGDAMADALFSAPVEDLTSEGCERIAQAVGLALAPYRACVADPATDAHIDADRAEFKAAGGFALPTLWIGTEQLVGAKSGPELQRALDRALTR